MPTEREFSAGGVVVRDGEVAVIVPTRRDRNGRKVLALPKGHPEAGESGEQAARREVREETGLEAEIVDRLGDVRYFYQREGRRIAKVVTFFLLEPRGEAADHDREVEAVLWMPFERAERDLTYRGERRVVALAKVHPACRS
jgi:ADP-ribose pyrophosphatase YjhB (NUDIX family)